MGEIATQAQAAYRAFVVDGSPGSGNKNPEKSEIIALFGKVDEKVSALEETAANVDGVVDAQALGARDDGGLTGGNTDNVAAFNAARTAASSTGVMRLRRKLGGSYKFSSGYVDLTGIFIDNDPGVILEGKVVVNNGDIAVRNPLLIKFNDGAGLYFDRWFFPLPQPDATASKAYLTPGQLPQRRRVVSTAMMSAQRVTFDTGTTYSVDSGVSLSAAGATWTTANDGYVRSVGIAPLSRFGLREVSWAWRDVLADNVVIGVQIRGTKGFIDIACLGDANTMQVQVRPDGGGDRNETIQQWPGRSYDTYWLPRTATWSLVALSPMEFALCLNGVQIKRMRTDEIGMIVNFGPAVRHSTAAATVSVVGLVARDGGDWAAGKLINVLVMGDSNTDTTGTVASPVHYSGGWLKSFIATLDGSSGLRLGSVVNLAEAGKTLTDQINAYNAYRAANPSQAFDLIIWNIGTNDIQNLTFYGDFYSALAPLVAASRTAGEKVILTVPGAFYTRTQSGGSGQASGNHATGTYIRQAIKQLAGAYSGGGYEVGVLDLQEVIGPELAEYLFASPKPATPAMLPDNIHWDDVGHTRIGYHMALLAQMLVAVRPERFSEAIEVPDQLCGPNFNPSTTTGAAPVFTACGEIWALDGFFQRVSGSNNGSVLIALPPHLAPERRTEIVSTDANGGIVYIRIYEFGHAQQGQVVIFTGSSETLIPANLSWRIA